MSHSGVLRLDTVDVSLYSRIEHSHVRYGHILAILSFSDPSHKLGVGMSARAALDTILFANQSLSHHFQLVNVSISMLHYFAKSALFVRFCDLAYFERRLHIREKNLATDG